MFGGKCYRKEIIVNTQEFSNNVVEVLQMIVNKTETKNNYLDLDVITIEELNKNHFECEVNYYLQKGYEIIDSSCNSKPWKAIMKRKDENKESDK